MATELEAFEFWFCALAYGQIVTYPITLKKIFLKKQSPNLITFKIVNAYFYLVYSFVLTSSGIHWFDAVALSSLKTNM